MSTEPTNEAIRITCAEAMGWKKIRRSSALGFEELVGVKPTLMVHEEPLPNYPEDDRSARELRESLTPEEQGMFADRLILNMKIGWEISKRSGLFKFLNASARDQAIAFLKVRGVKL